MNLCIVCCLHGTEPYGLEVIRGLPALPFIIGNPQALLKGVRFIDSDLNRCFPGDKEGDYENKLARNLVKRLENYDYILDLHSSSNNCPIFGIITKPNPEKIEFAKELGLKRLVIMTPSFASGKALIDFAKCGISIEVGPHNRKENAEEASQLVNNYLENKNYEENIEIFEVFDIIKKESDNILINNFDEVKKGQLIADNQHSPYDFIPVLVNEAAYKGVLCLACRRVTL